MELQTASSVINHIADIESQSANWYARHARSHKTLEPLFTGFAAENRKFGKRLKKAYYRAATDALETNFGFQGLDSVVEIPQIPDSADPKDLLMQSLEMEKSIQSFYLRAAEFSADLLADLSRAMERIGRERDKRLGRLQARVQQP